MQKSNYKYYCYIFMSIICFTNISCNVEGDYKTLSSSEANEKFANATIAELNILRSNPIGYFNKKSYFDSTKKISEPCNDGGKESYSIVQSELKDPQPPLVLDDLLNNSARKYARYLAENNKLGHYELGTPSERCEDAGYLIGCTENLATNSNSLMNATIETNIVNAAKMFIEQFARDCDNGDGKNAKYRGHLRAMLNGDMQVVGIGFFNDPYSIYKNYTVQNFGKLKEYSHGMYFLYQSINKLTNKPTNTVNNKKLLFS